MSHVYFKKRQCRPVEFKGQGPLTCLGLCLQFDFPVLMPHLLLVLVKAGDVVIALVTPGTLVRGSIVEDLTVREKVVLALTSIPYRPMSTV